MPIGIQRLNAHQSHPNDRIVFIKPLPGPTAALAQDFLSRIAAICKPIMINAHISVMTLEEYEPNPEFVGRNFNAGEIIQLVLKAPHTGHWLSFRSVQMVMMHELAHCVQMNHGKDFWKTRNQYTAELRELWGKGYMGDGFWGRGKTLLSERYEHQGSWEEEVMPERLCGGTFRTRRGRKRKRGTVKSEKPSYAERQQRRIEKKFGKNGQQLGEEEELRVKLENGTKPKGKPRVAGSARGRELRAAAALARFGPPKEEEALGATGSDSDSGSEFEDVKPEKEALDLNGSKLLDGKGRGMVKICEDEDKDDVHVKQEMNELHDLSNIPVESYHENSHTSQKDDTSLEGRRYNRIQTDKTSNDAHPSSVVIKHENSRPPPIIQPQSQGSGHSTPKGEECPSNVSCPLCSMINERSALICLACSHVLQPQLMQSTWRCQSSTCQGSKYLNAGDCGLCGVCGSSRPTGEE